MRRAFAALLLLTALTGACFSPSYERCAIECASGTCPPDTYCLSDGRCHASPDEELCAAAELIDGGTPDGDGDPTSTPDATTFDAGIPVTPTEAGQLVVSEIFKNPSDFDEEDFEWFEIHNPTELRFELQGLEVRDDMGETFDIVSSVVIGPGGRAVFARNGEAATNGGIDEDYDYDDAFALGNSGDVIELVYPLGDVVLDRVEYGSGPAGWPNNEGESMSLDPGQHEAAANDDPASWCDAAPTPDVPNPDC